MVCSYMVCKGPPLHQAHNCLIIGYANMRYKDKGMQVMVCKGPPLHKRTQLRD